MFNTFPSLLSYGFFAPLIIRVAVAVFFVAHAAAHFRHKKAVASEVAGKFKFLSHETAVLGVGILILGELALAALFFVGAWTQVASLFAVTGLLKLSFFKRALPSYAPFARSTYLLVIVLCLSLLITGAGALAFDLPL
jgi:uncharacterized membrane protein YphA (DoxX/SURF4 family)